MKNLAALIALMSLVACSKSKPQPKPGTQGGIVEKQDQRSQVTEESVVAKKITEVYTLVEEQLDLVEKSDQVKINFDPVEKTEFLAVTIEAGLQEIFNKAIQNQDKTEIAVRATAIQEAVLKVKEAIKGEIEALQAFVVENAGRVEVTAKERELLNLLADLLEELTIFSNLDPLVAELDKEYERSILLPEQQRNEQGEVEVQRAYSKVRIQINSEALCSKLTELINKKEEVKKKFEDAGATVDFNNAEQKYVQLDLEALQKESLEANDLTIAIKKVEQIETIALENTAAVIAKMDLLDRFITIQTTLKQIEITDDEKKDIKLLERVEDTLETLKNLDQLIQDLTKGFNEAQNAEGGDTNGEDGDDQTNG